MKRELAACVCFTPVECTLAPCHSVMGKMWKWWTWNEKDEIQKISCNSKVVNGHHEVHKDTSCHLY